MKFKIRASSCGQIMTNPRGKAESISKTAQSYAKQWLTEKLYNRTKEIKSKYLDKGILCEAESIDFLGDYFGLGMLIKNDEQFENNWVTGEPDVILPDKIIDVKNSWSPFTFPYFETDNPNKSYYWQGQCYMSLTGANEFWLVYVLSDTPDHLIEREARYFARNIGMDEPDESIWHHFVDTMRYKDIPDDLKIKRFIINRDDAVIQGIFDRVELVRYYIDQELMTDEIKKHLKESK